MKERISNAADFPGLVVYRQAGPAGPVYSVEFSHKEHPGKFWTYFFSFAGIGCIGAALWYADLRWAGAVVAAIVLSFLAWQPRRVERAIELDFSKDEFRVKRGAKITLRKPLSRRRIEMRVEPHKWIMSRDSGKRITGAKQHCLVGYFGVAGTDRELLFCRQEREIVRGLREVAEAVMWAWEAGCRE
jgi:hypothetical protein